MKQSLDLEPDRPRSLGAGTIIAAVVCAGALASAQCAPEDVDDSGSNVTQGLDIGTGSLTK